MTGGSKGKEKLYEFLAQKYGWTFQEIANMTPKNQQVACGVVDNTLTFNTMREYEAWRMSSGK